MLWQPRCCTIWMRPSAGLVIHVLQQCWIAQLTMDAAALKLLGQIFTMDLGRAKVRSPDQLINDLSTEPPQSHSLTDMAESTRFDLSRTWISAM